MHNLNNALAWIIIELNKNIVQTQKQSTWLRIFMGPMQVYCSTSDLRGSETDLSCHKQEKNYPQDKRNTCKGFKDCYRFF